MDPITLIVTALIAGAASGLQGVAGDAVKDAYRSLKDAIRRRSGSGSGSSSEVDVALTRAERNPEVWTEPLKEVLTDIGAGQDLEIVRTAQTLMSLVDPERAAGGRYQVNIAGNVQGFAQGDHQHVEMNFGPKPDPA